MYTPPHINHVMVDGVPIKTSQLSSSGKDCPPEMKKAFDNSAYCILATKGVDQTVDFVVPT